jgi:hypothetical protein
MDVQLDWEQFWKLFGEALRAATKQYGPGVALLILAVVGLFAVNQAIWLMLLRATRAELKRVIEERNKYIEKFVLKKRLSTSQTSGPTKALSGKGHGQQKGQKR